MDIRELLREDIMIMDLTATCHSVRRYRPCSYYR